MKKYNVSGFPYPTPFFLRLTTVCTLDCPDCPILGTPDTYSDTLSFSKALDYLVESKRFQQARDLHIYGGEPFLSPHFHMVFNKKKCLEKSIYVWSTGAVNLGLFEPYFSFIKGVFVYLPGPDASLDEAYSGGGSWQRQWEGVSFLKDLPVSVTLVHRIRPEAIDFLPLLHEHCFGLNLPLVLIYDTSIFSVDQRRYIMRYNHEPNVQVLKDVNLGQSCQGFPRQALESWMQWIFNRIHHMLIP